MAAAGERKEKKGFPLLIAVDGRRVLIVSDHLARPWGVIDSKSLSFLIGSLLLHSRLDPLLEVIIIVVLFV